MKKSFLFILAVGTFLTSYAGDPTDKIIIKKPFAAPEDGGNKLSIGLSVGTTIPLQAFGDKSASTDTTGTRVNGAAKTGFHYNVTFGYRFSKYVGGMLLVGGSVNGFAPDAGASSGFVTTTYKAGSHYVGQYLVGPYLAIPVGKKLSIEVRALVGLITSSYPKVSESFSVSYYGYSFSGSTSTSFKTGATFGYSAGIGAKYMLNDHIGVTLNAAYAGSSMVYPGNTTTATTTSSFAAPTNSTTTSDTHTKMSIGMINITAGIAYCF